METGERMRQRTSRATGPVRDGNATGNVGRRRVLESVAAGSVTATLAGCTSTAESIADSSDEDDEGNAGDDAITIGLLAPHPERDFVGRSMRRAAELAVDEVERIDGRPVDLVVGNTGGDPLEARREYQRLVLKGDADVTVGIFDSPTLEHVLEDVAEQETLHLTTGAATTAASEAVREDYDRYRYHFRVGPTNTHDLARAHVDFLAEMVPELGWESIALLAEDYDWTAEPWAVYQEELGDLGIEVVLEERYPPAIDDFSGRYEAAARAGADVVFITAAHTGTAAVLDWHRGQWPFAFGGTHVPMQLPTYYEQTDGASRFGFGQIAATATNDFDGETQPFVSAYEARYGDTPVYTGYHVYDAISLFATAVESTGSTDEDDLIPALEDGTFSGTTGTIEFHDRDHEFPHDLVYQEGETLYFQWQDDGDGAGVQEVVWPEEHATASYVEPDWF